MGQAKRRGTFEERQRDAQLRNAELEKRIAPNSNAHKFQRQHGTQRFATRLVMAGVMKYQDNKR